MELFLDILAIRVDSRKAESLRFTMNLQTPDNGEQFIVELNNSTLTHIKGFQLKSPGLTLVINRCDLELVMAGATTLFALIAAGTARLEGDGQLLQQLRDVLIQFSPSFDIMPGTNQYHLTAAPIEEPDSSATPDPFSQAEPASAAGA